MLYKKNAETKLSRELFENPTSEYRGTPLLVLELSCDKRTDCGSAGDFPEDGLWRCTPASSHRSGNTVPE